MNQCYKYRRYIGNIAIYRDVNSLAIYRPDIFSIFLAIFPDFLVIFADFLAIFVDFITIFADF